jgi:hypothetical protein
MWRALSIAAVCVVACGLGPALAYAQSAEAEATFLEGDRLMTAGKLAEACDAFEASNKVEQRAGTLIRLGECREKNRQLASAWSAYKDALTRVKDPRKRDFAFARANEIEPKLSFLTISIPDDSRIDGLMITRNGKPVDPLLWNRAVPVDGGPYTVAGRAPGHEAWQTTVEVPIEHGKVSVDVPKFKELVKLLAPSPAPAPIEPHAPNVKPPPAPGRFTAKRKAAIGFCAGAVLGVTAGITTGLLARSKQDQADALCPDPNLPCAETPRARSLNHSAHGLAIGADIGFGVGAALAIGAGVLWVTGGGETSHGLAVVPQLTGQDLGLAIGGAF